MTNEIPTTPQYGEPINLNYPSNTDSRLEAAALKLTADVGIVNTAKLRMGDSGADQTGSVSDTDLRRQIETERLARMETSKKDALAKTDTQLAVKTREIEQSNMVTKIINKIEARLNGVMDNEQNKIYLESVKSGILAEIATQAQTVQDLETAIKNSPDLLKKATERAYEESQIVQRVALGFAIKEAVGAYSSSEPPVTEKIEQYVDAYNKGEFHIEDRHYERGLNTYDNLVRRLRNSMLDHRVEEKIGNFYSPAEQVKSAQRESQSSVNTAL